MVVIKVVRTVERDSSFREGERLLSEEKISKNDAVFISHIGAEAAVALKLKQLIQDTFGADLPVFVSSDYESIQSGEEWYRKIVESIKASKVVIVLISPESVDRPWINFEAGVGVGSNGKVFPIAIRGFRLGDLRPPLQALHARDIHDPNSIKAIIRDIGSAIKRVPNEVDAESFVAEIHRVEGRLTYKGIVLRPFVGSRWEDAAEINFELSNTGTQELELLEIEVLIPEILISPKALHIFDANYIDATTTTDHGVRYFKMTYKDYAGSPNMHVGVTEPLPRVVTTSMGPRVFRNFRTRIRTTLTEAELSMLIRHQVYVRGFKTEMTEVSVRELLNTTKLTTP